MLVNWTEIDVEDIYATSKDKVEAVKRVQKLSGSSLKEAKDAVDSYLLGKQNQPGQTQRGEWGTKKESKYIESILHKDETILAMASGMLDGKTWVIACTNKRILFVDCGLLYGRKYSEILIDKVNAVSYKNNLLSSEIYIEDGATTRVIKNVQKTLVTPFINAVHKAKEKAEKPTSKNLSGTVSAADEILKFKQLLDAGIITQEEFEQQKKKLLEE